MSDINKKAAEILVLSGYAKALAKDKDGIIEGFVRVRNSGYDLHEKVDPLSDSFESRKQLDALFWYFINSIVQPIEQA